MRSLDELKISGDAPEFLTEDGYTTMSGGYLLKNETPKQLYLRVSNAAASRLKKPELAPKFFDLLWFNWLGLSSPIASNLGTDNLPISCFSSSVPDSTHDIFSHFREIAMLSKYGGGTGSYWGNVRGRGTPISKGGFSEGVSPWLNVLEKSVKAVSQGSMRRGSVAAYLDMEHIDIEEFMNIRINDGDISMKCLSNVFHHGVCISDEFMNSLKDGHQKNRKLWEQLLTNRVEFGEPYLMFKDTANNANPACYKDKGLKVETSNLCNEIYLHTDADHTFVCCLSSMNIARFDEWKNTDAVYLATMFLDGVMQEFIDKAKNITGFEKSVRFAEKSRALGLGVIGWHTLLQSKMIPFDSFEAMQLNAEVFRHIDRESLRASIDMATEYGEPEWCKGHGVRNTHLTAIAPTTTNSLLAGGVSQGIEPLSANLFNQKTSKGVFFRKNPILEKLLDEKGFNSIDTWNQINEDRGSVKNIKCLSALEKEVFLTAREINQFAIVRQAGQRQKWISQGQSVNLFFAMPSSVIDQEEKDKLSLYIHQVHMEAWELGLKGLYYLKTESMLKGESVFKDSTDCKACEG